MTGNQMPGNGKPVPVALSKSKKSMFWLIITISAVALAGLCIGVYFLFFAGKQPTGQQQSALSPPAKTAEAATQKPASEVDYATTRDVADLIGVWAGELKYTELSGDGILLLSCVDRIHSAIQNQNHAAAERMAAGFMRIDGGDAAV
jgi:hypothetical protein